MKIALLVGLFLSISIASANPLVGVYELSGGGTQDIFTFDADGSTLYRIGDDLRSCDQYKLGRNNFEIRKLYDATDDVEIEEYNIEDLLVCNDPKYPKDIDVIGVNYDDDGIILGKVALEYDELELSIFENDTLSAYIENPIDDMDSKIYATRIGDVSINSKATELSITFINGTRKSVSVKCENIPFSSVVSGADKRSSEDFKSLKKLQFCNVDALNFRSDNSLISPVVKYYDDESFIIGTFEYENELKNKIIEFEDLETDNFLKRIGNE